MKKFSLDDKIMTEEEWRAIVPHESEAEVPPVPTYGKIVEYVYDTALRDAGERADSSRAE